MIYADNAATTKISDTAIVKMLPFLHEQYGNASSQYSFGIKAKSAVEYARQQLASAIGAQSSEITFTSGGSESNSWVLRGVTETFNSDKIHIITSSIEHHSVLNAFHAIETKGIEITYLPVDSFGLVSIDDLKAEIRPNTKLVSIMLANNEIGTIQPVEEIGQFLHNRNILLHTDAVQAVGHIPIDVSELHVDFLTASAHKFNGPKGIGVLFKRSGLKLPQLIFGGAQEQGARAGTENVANIVAAGYALDECVSEMKLIAEKLNSFVQMTIDGIRARIPNIHINGDSRTRLPGLINISFDNISGESLMHLLDLKGICVSTSSACTAGRDEPSHVLMAIGLSEQQAKSAIRISYGKYNTRQEVDSVITAVCESYVKILGATSR